VLTDSLTDNSLDAAKFVLGRVAGWTEKSVVDNTSSDGSMTPTRIVIEAAKSDDQRDD
jgi:hypothetical protein